SALVYRCEALSGAAPSWVWLFTAQGYRSRSGEFRPGEPTRVLLVAERAERLDLARRTGDDQLVGALDRRLGPRVGEVLAATLDPDDRDAEPGAQLRLVQRATGGELGRPRARDREAVVEL